jgi:hypothetical protein
LLELSKFGPEKGFEMSIILEKDAKTFKYPTPFILHYSNAFEERYLNESDFTCGNSVDPDLATHITVIMHRGICLFGQPIKTVFQPVPKRYYIDSIIKDIESAKEEIVYNPFYFTLNLCRVLYYLEEGVICSKKEGGEWAVDKVSYPYIDTIKLALLGYCSSENTFAWSHEQLICFADFMLKKIQSLVLKTKNLDC